MPEKSFIRQLPTGVPGLDELLCGGLSEFSFNLIAGSPGSGKTTLAHQIMFALAKPERPALFFTVLGEPSLKMVRYQQQYGFYDVAKLGNVVRFFNLADEVVDGDFERVLARILEEVERFEPGLVFVDSFRSVVVAAQSAGSSGSVLQQFVQRLGIHLTSWQATTFLIGEYMSPDAEANPVFTIADGVLWLAQSVHRNSMVRKIQVTKSRGHPALAGLHTFRIGDEGIRVFPRTILAPQSTARTPRVKGDKRAPLQRLSMGIPLLDEMMGGGLPVGYSLLISGPSGSGKSVLATAFLAEGARIGEKGVVAAFEQTLGSSRNSQLDDLVADGHVVVVDTQALDLSIDETLFKMAESIRLTGAKRVVIDSLSAFELALAPTFREDFRESLYRMVVALTGLGATVLMVSELEDRYTDLRFSPYGSAFLTDGIIVQRYVELNGDLQRVMAVVKLRNSAHSRTLRIFDITDDGIVIQPPDPRIVALLTGHPHSTSPVPSTPQGSIEPV